MTTQTPKSTSLRSARRFTVKEYYRMAEAGILHQDDRVELIDGRSVELAPIGSRDSSRVKGINKPFRDYPGERVTRVTIEIQDPIRLDDGSEPQPSISILQLELSATPFSPNGEASLPRKPYPTLRSRLTIFYPRQKRRHRQPAQRSATTFRPRAIPSPGR